MRLRREVTLVGEAERVSLAFSLKGMMMMMKGRVKLEVAPFD